MEQSTETKSSTEMSDERILVDENNTLPIPVLLGMPKIPVSQPNAFSIITHPKLLLSLPPLQSSSCSSSCPTPVQKLVKAAEQYLNHGEDSDVHGRFKESLQQVILENSQQVKTSNEKEKSKTNYYSKNILDMVAGDRDIVHESLPKAAVFNHIDIITLLLEYGLDPDTRNSKSFTALMYAGNRSYIPILSLLLDHGANVNVQNKFGCTALILASLNGKPDAIQLLLENGADRDLETTYGKKAIDISTNAQVTSLLQNFFPTSYLLK